MDYYVEAQKVIERNEILPDSGSAVMPSVGLSIDRRVISHVSEVYKEESVKCLVCFVCAEKNLYHKSFDRKGKPFTRGCEIDYFKVQSLAEHLMNAPNDESFVKNLSFARFRDLYCNAKKYTDAGSQTLSKEENLKNFELSKR